MLFLVVKQIRVWLLDNKYIALICLSHLFTTLATPNSVTPSAARDRRYLADGAISQARRRKEGILGSAEFLKGQHCSNSTPGLGFVCPPILRA